MPAHRRAVATRRCNKQPNADYEKRWEGKVPAQEPMYDICLKMRHTMTLAVIPFAALIAPNLAPTARCHAAGTDLAETTIGRLSVAAGMMLLPGY